jgi:hypothetical protein
MRLCPDLASTEAVPDGQLHPTELEGVSRLKDVDIVTIDGALLANSTASWQRASRVIGHALVTLNNQFANVAFGFYAQRVAALVQDGRLQAQGDLAFMRLCEVRLSAPAEGAA